MTVTVTVVPKPTVPRKFTVQVSRTLTFLRTYEVEAVDADDAHAAARQRDAGESATSGALTGRTVSTAIVVGP